MSRTSLTGYRPVTYGRGQCGAWTARQYGRPPAVEDAARLLQLVINGAAAGCIYGLIALGFVLIYKATEMVNFAQGDIMMLGAFLAFALVTTFGLNYWLAALIAIAAIAAFGYALDAMILRRVIGQPQFA